MSRALAVSVATVALLVCAVPAAGALELKLSASMQTAMTDNYVYWVKQTPRGCRNCNQLWRTALGDGSSEPALQARKGTIARIVARGSLIGITEVFRSKSRFQSRVRVINEDGKTRVLARAVYWPSVSRNCGSIVGVGSLSPTGELAWQRIDVPRSKFTCRELPDRTLWSAYGGGLDRTTRKLVKQRKQPSILLYFGEALGQVRPILGFDGDRLLTAPDSGALTATDIRSGATTRYRFAGDSSYSQTGELGLGGQVATSFYSNTLDKSVPVLFISPMSSLPAIDLHVEGHETSTLKFCGEALVQVTFNEKQGDIGVYRRDMAGTVTSSKIFKLGAGAAIPSFDCNGSQGVIFYFNKNSEGRVTAEKAFSLEL